MKTTAIAKEDDPIDTELYVVTWRVNVTGATGHGQPMAKKAAEAIAAAANIENPGVSHRVLPAYVTNS